MYLFLILILPACFATCLLVSAGHCSVLFGVMSSISLGGWSSLFCDVVSSVSLGACSSLFLDVVFSVLLDACSSLFSDVGCTSSSIDDRCKFICSELSLAFAKDWSVSVVGEIVFFRSVIWLSDV